MFEGRMKSAMAKVHENNNAYSKVEIIQLNNGSIIANLLLTFTDQNTQGLTELFAAIRNSSFGDFSVDPDALTVVIRGACPYDKCPGNSTCKQLTADTISCPCKDGYYYDGVSCIEFTKIKVEVSLEKEFTNDLKNKSSEAYKSLERNVTAELHERFKDTPNFEEVRVSGFSNGSVVVKFLVLYRQGEMSKVVVGEEVRKIIETGELGGYKVIDGLVKAPPPAPEKLILADVTHNRIEIKWTKPIAHLAFEIKGYTISHKTVAETTFKTDEFDSDSTNSVLGDLESDTFYVIQIRAKNDEGIGEKQEMQVSTEKPASSMLVTIIIIVIVVVLLLIIGMVVFFHLRKRRHLQEVRQRAHAQAQMPNPIPLSTTQYDNFGQGDEEAHGSQKL